MRDYATVSPRFWIGETGKAVRQAGRDVQLVALYLLTCPNSNMIGLYYLPLPILTHETGLSTEGASKALRRLSEGGFAHYDEHQEVVWVPKMARFQVAERLAVNDKRCKGIQRELEKYANSRFCNDFLALYGEVYNLDLHAIAKPLPSPSEAPSKPSEARNRSRNRNLLQVLRLRRRSRRGDLSHHLPRRNVAAARP